MRRSGHGALGSRMRARSTFRVVIVTFTVDRFLRPIWSQQIEIAEKQVSFGDDGRDPGLVPCQFFQDSASHFEAALGGLIGIGGGPNRNLLARFTRRNSWRSRFAACCLT